MALPRQTFTYLSDDIILNILKRLDDPESLKSCRLICKHLLNLEGSLRTAINVRIPSFALRLPYHFPALHTLDFSACHQVTDQQVNVLAQAYKGSLTHLNFIGNKLLTDMAVQHLAAHCPDLVELLLSGCSRLTDGALFALARCSKIEVLQLNNCRQITDAGLDSLGSHCQGLKELTLRWCMNVSDRGFISVTSNCLQIQALDLSYTEVTARAIQAISKLGQLETLVLAACHAVDDFAMTCLRHGCTSLTSLDVSGCQGVSENGLNELARGSIPLCHLSVAFCRQVTFGGLRLLPFFPKLQRLKCNGCPLTEVSLLGFDGMESCKLAEFSLWRCESTTDMGIACMAARCPYLTSLDLTCCRELTDDSLHNLASCCRELRCLHIEGCQKLTSEGLAVLANGCQALEVLDLTDCNADDAKLEVVARFSKLRTLKLGFALLATDRGISQIAQGCPHLENLDLYRCMGLRDAGMAAIAERCKDLKDVNLSYCRQLKDASIMSLARHCHALQNLELRGCVNLTFEGIKEISYGCPRLQELDLKRCQGVRDDALIAISQGRNLLHHINLSYSAVTDVGLLAVAGMPLMRNIKLMHCHNVTIPGLVTALLACRGLLKVKLLDSIRPQFPQEAIAELERRGCKLRWQDKAEPPNEPAIQAAT